MQTMLTCVVSSLWLKLTYFPLPTYGCSLMTKPRRDKGRSSLTPTPLVTQQKKRPAKPARSGSGRRTATLPAAERDIVLDRLEKEICPRILKPGTNGSDRVKRRLRKGINEVAKFLEGRAAAASRGDLGEKGASTAAVVVLICADVPARLVEHLHTLVAVTGTPHLVLPGACEKLGRIFGARSMAAFAIGPAPPPPPPAPAEDDQQGSRGMGGGPAAEAPKVEGNVSKEEDCDPAKDFSPGGVPAGVQSEPSSDSAREGHGAAAAARREEGQRLPEDEDVDSFVAFLRRKCVSP